MRKLCKNCRRPTVNRDGYCDECKAEWRKSHPRQQEDRPSPTERGYDGRWKAFARRFLREHPVCAICGRPAQVVDHRVYTARQMMDAYGHFDYNPELYQALCYSCNNRKAQTSDRRSDAEYFREKEALGGGSIFSGTPVDLRGSGFSHTRGDSLSGAEGGLDESDT